MNTPTPEQLAKLPKWAQEHITDLTRRTADAERTFQEHIDTQTKSPFFIEDYQTFGEGDKHTVQYIQTHRLSVVNDGVRLDILLRDNEPGIEVSWSDEQRGMREVAMVPTSFQKMRLVSKNNMRA